MRDKAKAMAPEGVTRLVAGRLNAGDAAGVAALYEPQAVLAYPADRPVTGREAIQAIYQQMAGAGVKFAVETPLPTVRFENLALTSTRSADNTGIRVQVLRRQPDGSWLRIIDRPKVPQPLPRWARPWDPAARAAIGSLRVAGALAIEARPCRGGLLPGCCVSSPPAGI
jgi:ketosteroid isomerase-like protein